MTSKVENGWRVRTADGLEVGVAVVRGGLAAAYRSRAPLASVEVEVDGKRYKSAGAHVRSDVEGLWVAELQEVAA